MTLLLAAAVGSLSLLRILALQKLVQVFFIGGFVHYLYNRVGEHLSCYLMIVMNVGTGC